MGLSAGAVPALFLGLGGLVAYLAGVCALAERRRLLRTGIPATALVKHRPAVPGDTSGRSAPLLQFPTADGGVMEEFSPVPSSRALPLVDGGLVAVAYDPEDPRRFLVRGRERRGLEYAFAGLGASLMLAALVLLVML
jgi:hypothetical protein